MNILMLTNTYLPHVGGVARSVETFAVAFRERGHRVLVVAPKFDGMPDIEQDVVRVPALLDLMGSGFSLPLPIPGLLSEALDAFRPNIVHSHHPYLLGMTAMRIARYHQLPLVFTHHTLYEEYTHYVAADAAAIRRFVAELATAYANLCEQVIAPSESLADLLRRRGVETSIEVIPTGVDVDGFSEGDGSALRARQGIPEEAFVVGHLGRLAPEKNVGYLAEAVAMFLHQTPQAHFLVVGNGPSAEEMTEILTRTGVAPRVHFAGVARGKQLTDAYHAMDAFAFTSQSETQGMVLTEAMAAGLPVVALDGPGVREVVSDGRNGRLLPSASPATEFAAAIDWIHDRPPTERSSLRREALKTADAFSVERTTKKALAVYSTQLSMAKHDQRQTQWEQLRELIKAEWEMMKGTAEAARFGFRLSQSDEQALK